MTKIVPIALALMLVSTVMVPAQANSCLAPPDIQNAVASGQILALDQILAQAGLSKNDVVGRFQVCAKDGTLYYEIPVLSGGTAQTLILNARTGGS